MTDFHEEFTHGEPFGNYPPYGNMPPFDLSAEDYFYNHSHINHVHFPNIKHRHTFEPWYSNHENYNTNAKSYYDYLGRFNGFLYEMVNQVNRLLRRNIKVKNTYSIDFHKDGDWIDNGDCKTKFDDIELLYANVIISKQIKQLQYQHIHRKSQTYQIPNGTEILPDGVYSPDYRAVLDEIDADLGEIHDGMDKMQDDIGKLQDDMEKVQDKLDELEKNAGGNDDLQAQIDEIKKKMPKGYTTLVTTLLWKGEAHGGDKITVSQALTDFNLIRVSFNIGASQFTSDIIPGLFASSNPEIVKFSGWDCAEPNMIFARTGMRCSDSSFKSLNVEQSVNYLRYVDESNNSVTLLQKGAGANGKTGNATISKIEGVKEITYDWS